MKEKGEIIFYEDGADNAQIEVKLEKETVWLTQDQMADLFQKAKSTINEHIKNIYSEQELDEQFTMNKKDESFQGSLAAIYQTFGGTDLYPSIEEKAANLLYL